MSRIQNFIFLNRPNPASFCLFSFFSYDKYSTNLTINDKSVIGVLGTQTRGGKMVGTDKSTELWRHPSKTLLVSFTTQTVSNPRPNCFKVPGPNKNHCSCQHIMFTFVQTLLSLYITKGPVKSIVS